MYLNKKTALAIAFGAVLLTGCKNGNNDSDIVDPPEPPPEVVVPITEIGIVGTPKAGATISANIECDTCDWKNTEKTYVEWTITDPKDPAYIVPPQRSKTITIPNKENLIVTMTFRSADAEGEAMKDVVKVFDLSKGTEGGFDTAAMHKFNASGFVIQINESIFLSSEDGNTSPSRVYLDGKQAPATDEQPDQEIVKEFAIAMPALDDKNGAYQRVELYEFPNKRWGIGADGSGKSTELTEFAGAELVTDSGDEFFVVKDRKIARFAASDLTTPIHEVELALDAEPFVGVGTMFELDGTNAVYFPAKGDPIPDVAISDMRFGSFFSTNDVSGYITTTDEVILLGSSLPAAAFTTTGVSQVIANRTSDEFTVIYKDKSIARVTDQGAKVIEVVSASDDLSVVGVAENTPTLVGDANLADVIKLNADASETDGAFKVLATSEATNGMFFEGSEPNTSCSDLINEAADTGVNVAAVVPNDSGVMFAADFDNVYVCNLNHASDDMGKKLTIRPVSQAMTKIELLKGSNSVYFFDGVAVSEYTFDIPVPPEPEVPEVPEGEEPPVPEVPDLKPIVEVEEIGEVDDSEEREAIGVENHKLGQNMAIVMSDSSQFIVGKMTAPNNGVLIEVPPLSKFNHLGTFCHRSECLSVHSNEAGNVTIQRIEGVNKPAELRYEGLIDREEPETLEEQH